MLWLTVKLKCRAIQIYIQGSLKMGIQSFLKAQKGDPDWAFTPAQYFDKEFKIIDVSLIELSPEKADSVMLRQTPSEKELLAKHLRIDIREGAVLDLCITNDATDKLQQVYIYDVRVRAGGNINFGLFVNGGKLNKHIIQVALDEGATFSAYGHVLNDVGGDCEVITKIEHRGPNSSSNQYFSCEAGKKSQSVYQGMVHVSEEAPFSQVGIENVNLITGQGGKCHSVPEVFNESDSTRVSTASGTELLDEERTYYLQTRGIKHSAAESLIISTHRMQVLNLIQSNEIKEEIEQLFIS